MNHNLFYKKNHSGFTMIELLVVVIILVILAATATFSYNTTKAKARDSKRKEDIKAIQAALYLYSRDNKGFYPRCSTPCIVRDITVPGGSNNIVPTYMKEYPIAPGQKTHDFVAGIITGNYTYIGTDNAGATACNTTYTCINFKIAACLENANDREKDTVLNSTQCPGGAASYTLTAPN